MWQQALLFAARNKLDQGGDIENKRHFAAAENGRPADATQVGKHATKRLDDGLEFAHQLVDDDAGTMPGKLDDDDALARRWLAFDFKEITQTDEGQRFAAQIEEVALAGKILLFDAFDDGVKWNDVGRLLDADQEAVDNRQRQWQTDDEG